MKATPEDYYQFYMETSNKYPSMYLPNVKDLPPLSTNEYKLFLSNNIKVLNNHYVLPYIDNENPIAKSIREKAEIYQKNLYISLSSLQMVEEKMRIKKSEEEKEYGYSANPEDNKEYLPTSYWKYIANATKDTTKIDEINERIEERKTEIKPEFDIIRSIKKLYVSNLYYYINNYQYIYIYI